MATRFELSLEHDKYVFHLRTPEGAVLLKGLGSTSKIMTQNEIAHVRMSLRDPARLVAHHADDGTHFLVVKDKDGSVLAKSEHVPTAAVLAEVTAKVQAAVPVAPIVDFTKRAAHSH